MKDPDVKKLYDKIEELIQEVEKLNRDYVEYVYMRDQQSYLRGKCQAYEEFLIKNNLIRDPKEIIKPIIGGTK